MILLYYTILIYIYIYIYMYIYIYIYMYNVYTVRAGPYGRLPKCHPVCLGRDPGTLKSLIVSKKHPQLICSDLRLSS